MQEFENIQNRYEGRLEENEWSVTQVIGSEAREAVRGQRSRMLHVHQVLLQEGARTKEFVKSHMHSELQSHIASYRRTLHDPEVERERITQNFEQQEAQLRVQLQAEELMMAPIKECFQKTSESKR